MSDDLYVAALALLGTVGGFAVVRLLFQYMDWVRSRYPWPMHRLLRAAFLIVPLLVFGLAFSVLSSVRERDTFFVGFLVGFVAAGVIDFIRWWRTRKG